VKGLALIGVFSYSLYLTHFCVLTAVNQVFKALGLNGLVHLRFIIFVVCCVAAGRLFFRVGEQPFLNWKRLTRQVRSQAAADVLESAAGARFEAVAPH
jgi:peptidoglycan/LPS O-acetylase OafA/YrhL